MTIGIAWVGARHDGREHLFFASDSRVRGGHHFDASPKILTLPRSDCAICFAGETAAAYPLMLQVAQAIAAHEPARQRSLDISKVKVHILRVLSDLIDRFKELTRTLHAAGRAVLIRGLFMADEGISNLDNILSQGEATLSGKRIINVP